MENDKNQITKEHFLEGVAYLLLETFEGSPEGKGSAYLDRGVGIFNTLEKLSADEASYEFHGTTIAAQTEHAKYYLDRICEFIQGRTERVNWDDSWLIETVNAAEWDALRESVKKSYENTLRSIATVETWDDTNLGMAVGMVVHTAYHLGAIRQINKAAKR
jgi:enamine deaminase RidA (YjgF/YER057c/UK114 family)